MFIRLETRTQLVEAILAQLYRPKPEEGKRPPLAWGTVSCYHPTRGYLFQTQVFSSGHQEFSNGDVGEGAYARYHPPVRLQFQGERLIRVIVGDVEQELGVLQLYVLSP